MACACRRLLSRGSIGSLVLGSSLISPRSTFFSFDFGIPSHLLLLFLSCILVSFSLLLLTFVSLDAVSTVTASITFPSHYHAWSFCSLHPLPASLCSCTPSSRPISTSCDNKYVSTHASLVQPFLRSCVSESLCLSLLLLPPSSSSSSSLLTLLFLTLLFLLTPSPSRHQQYLYCRPLLNFSSCSLPLLFSSLLTFDYLHGLLTHWQPLAAQLFCILYTASSSRLDIQIVPTICNILLLPLFLQLFSILCIFFSILSIRRRSVQSTAPAQQSPNLHIDAQICRPS